MTAADWFAADEPLRDHELMAVRFLAANGSHQIGVIDDESKMAAALTFVGLMHKGMVIGGIGEEGKGPTYRLTAKGRAAVAATSDETPNGGTNG